MKKIWLFLKNFFIKSAADAIIDEAGDLIDESLETFYKNDPVACTAMVKSVYAFVPYLQRMTAKTTTPLDDKGVEEIKLELEEFASRHEIVL